MLLSSEWNGSSPIYKAVLVSVLGFTAHNRQTFNPDMTFWKSYLSVRIRGQRSHLGDEVFSIFLACTIKSTYDIAWESDKPLDYQFRV